MLHPQTELGAVSPDIGVGVFAREFIPVGTIVYIKEPLEIVIQETDPRLSVPSIRSIIDRYSYIEPTGARVVSWDLAKYVNHSCNPNTISTGYGFEIACRDIFEGDEVTDDYGLLNIETIMPCSCGSSQCRRQIQPDDLKRYHQAWDETVRQALQRFRSVEQPLATWLDDLTRHQLEQYLEHGIGYLSVERLYRERRSVTDYRQAL